MGDAGLANLPKNDAGQPSCNDITISGTWLDQATLVPMNGGILLPNGALEYPMGGDVADGDYDLVELRLQSAGSYKTRRSIRVFEQATHIEWAADIVDESINGNVTYNTSTHVDREFLTVDTVDCDNLGTFSPRSYRFTGNTEYLTLYHYGGAPDMEVGSAYTYQRRCTR